MSNDHNADECKRFAGERERFEAWIVPLYLKLYEMEPDLQRTEYDGEPYFDPDVSNAWTAWQARAAQPAPVVPEGWRLVERPTYFSLMRGNTIVASLVGPDAEENASVIAQLLAAAPAQGQQVECQECERLRQWKAEQMAVMTPVIEYAREIGECELGGSLTGWLIDDHRRTRAELSALKAEQVGQEPVAEVSEETFSSDGTSDIITRNLPIGTKLYTASPAQDVANVRKMARALSDRQADACNVDREDQWKVYSEDFVTDVEAMLAAAHDKQSGGDT